MVDPNKDNKAEDNLQKVVDVAAGIDVDSQQAKDNEKGMVSGAKGIKYNDLTLPDKF